MTAKTLSATLLSLFASATLHAADSSLFVSLQDHYLNGRIEQMAVVANLPTLKKPYNVREVRHFLPRIAQRYSGLHQQISAGLQRYSGTGISRAEITIAHGRSDTPEKLLANARGERLESQYRVSAAGHYQGPSWLAVSLGAIALDQPDDVLPVDSYFVLGGDSFQLDVGYREHWLSPMLQSAMLLSSNARSFASIGVSNPLPLENWWNLHYEFFVGRLEHTEHIRNGTLIESGNPLLLGTHMSMEPLSGWTIGLTRTLQFGGGSRDTGLDDVWDALIDPVSNDNPDSGDCVEANTDECEVGNQQAAISSRIHFGGKIPFSLYFEYAGEDTASFSNSRLGNLAISGGIFVPFLYNGNWSFNYEFSEWQNGWYTHDIYLDGYTNDGVVMGHWGGNERVPGSSAGAKAQIITIGWQIDRNQRLELGYQNLENEDYSTFDYATAEYLTINYRNVWQNHPFGAMAKIGHDVFGERLARIEIQMSW